VATSPAEPRIENPEDVQVLDASEGRRVLSGFFLFGLLMSFLGAILPAWRYHLIPDFTAVGYYFLSLNVGILVSAYAAQRLVSRTGIRLLLMVACAVAAASFLFLALVPPPSPAIWRMIGLFGIGCGAGGLNTAVFHAISPLYQHDRASTVNVAGILYGIGCVLTALLVAGTYYVYTVASILVFFAAILALYIGVYSKKHFSSSPQFHRLPIRQVLNDFKNPGAVMFTLLLFFQFGNEWSIAGWLALFLTWRLGISPEASLILLALYWGALLVGRIVAQVALKRAGRGWVLSGSILSALLGCTILCFTTTRFGAVMGILFVGGGFASVYPLVVENIRTRFPYYHPGFYNGVFSFAFTGGLLAPWTLGYMAEAWGIRVVAVVPLLGTCVVFLLSLLIMLEAKLNGDLRRP
jgi:FHS family glucose/mannose:H+ symporter-like MFS transporter